MPDSPQQTRWYAIRTRYRFEKKVTAQLHCKGLETFLPMLGEIHRWSDRQKAVNVPLFSGYTFAHFDLSSAQRIELLRTQGIIALVTFGSETIPVPDRQIADLQQLLSVRVPCSLRAFLKAGQKVRIRGGCLDGLEGILEQSGEKSLVISIESIERSVAIKIEGYELELI